MHISYTCEGRGMYLTIEKHATRVHIVTPDGIRVCCVCMYMYSIYIYSGRTGRKRRYIYIYIYKGDCMRNVAAADVWYAAAIYYSAGMPHSSRRRGACEEWLERVDIRVCVYFIGLLYTYIHMYLVPDKDSRANHRGWRAAGRTFSLT